MPRFHGEEQLAGWAKVAEAVHAGGGTIVPQLWHIGMVRSQGRAGHRLPACHGATAVPLGPRRRAPCRAARGAVADGRR
ncbi:hypothetical protein SFUMM280S_07004 [Streptomyces fumanus]